MRQRASPTLFALVVLLAATFVQSARCAELKKETTAAFDRYILVSEQRINAELNGGQILFVDTLRANERAEKYEQLRNQQIVLRQVNAKEEGRVIQTPHGLIHDWVGVIYVPGVYLSDVVGIIQDYDNHEKIYKPEVRVSRLIMRTGSESKVFLQLYKKSVVTVVINADFDIFEKRVGSNAITIRSYSTRMAEVENVDSPNARELPVDGGHGYLWRLYSYWTLQEKDGGVYVQLETIALTRSVPAVFAWLVNPLLRSIPRATLSNLLSATRAAVMSRTNRPAEIQNSKRDAQN